MLKNMSVKIKKKNTSGNYVGNKLYNKEMR